MLVYLQAIQTQEEKSKFEILYREYRKYMYRVAYAILNNAADAEDAVHTAFVKIAENIEKIEDPVGVQTKGFLATIVRNTAIDLYRRKQAYPGAEYIDATHAADAEYDGDNGVARCILQLPERQQSVLILRYQYGYTLYEIAKMLGITYINAKQIDRRAREKLHTLCEEEGIQC